MVGDVTGIDFNHPVLKIQRQSISSKSIEAKQTEKGGYRHETLESWGVPCPPPKGWKEALIEYGYPLYRLDTSTKVMRRKSVKKADNMTRHVRRFSGKVKSAARNGSQRPAQSDSREQFYRSWDWRTVRMEVLKERGARCECCGATPSDTDTSGKLVKICVDHIKPLARYWHLRLDKTNLQILCDECNQGKGAWDETDWRAANDDEVPDALKEQLRYSV